MELNPNNSEQIEPSQDGAAELNFDTQPIEPKVKTIADRIQQEIMKVVVGQYDSVELLTAALFTGGHVLIEGLPGIAKTLTAKLLAKSIASDFSRIQFTPDLMPTDITGTSVFNMKESNFYFRKGPLFSNIVLVDEVNRAPAKTQAALMEVMEETQVTYDGVTYPMGFPFFIVATQNPVEQEGTYSLPEAQLDRFVFRIKMGYPDLQGEELILRRFQNDFKGSINESVNPVCTAEDLKECMQLIQNVRIEDSALKYIASIVHNTRNNGDIFLGASPRASLAILRTSKAIAAIRGRDFVIPDDILTVAMPALNHRVVLSHEREMEGRTVEEIIETIIQRIEVPR